MDGRRTRHRTRAYSGAATPGLWRFTYPQFGEETVEPSVALWSDDADMLIPALLAGHGVAVQPEFLVWRELRDGTLEMAMQEWASPVPALHLVMPPSTLRASLPFPSG